ncbi:MAG: diguanylate cyclase [Dehalococcoidia bacterium]
MSIQILVPLIATLAYIPLFIILLYNRPWQRRQKLFFLFLVPAVLWSLSSFLFRSDILLQDKTLELKTLEVRIVVCLSIWVLVQFRRFGASFYKSERTRFPLTYLFLIATIALAASGLIPRGVEQTATGAVSVDYGPWIVAITLSFLFTVGVKDIRGLLQRYRLSDDPAERNQILYIFASIVVLVTFFVGVMAPGGAEYPVSHIGNFITACILTYAVVAYRLLDVRVVFRWAFINLILYGGGLGIVLLFSWLAHRQGGIKPGFGSLALTLALGIPFILLLIRTVGARWRSKVEEAFVGTRHAYRKQLSQFISKIPDISTMEQFARDFVPLVAQSIDCRRACLLMPNAEEACFCARFVYPPVPDNPMGELNLRLDSPVVRWLKENRTILAARNLDISPDFQAMWQDEKEELRLAEAKMFIPLINREELVGILVISGRRDAKLYNVEDIDLLESVVLQVAASMEKEYLHEQLKEHQQEISLVNRLTTIITSSVSIQMIFDGFTTELRQVADVDWATIAVVDENELYVMALSGAAGSSWRAEERIALEGTATELVCRERKTIYEPDLSRQHRFWTGEHHLAQGVRSIVYLPLSVTDRDIGSLILGSRKANAYSPGQIKLLEKVASQIAAPIENAQLYARAEQRARIDELTGLFNRRHFEERLKEEISRHSRYGEAFSVLIIDLDNFKTYNDIYGHPSGDTLLNHVGRIIKGSVREADQAFRYGGDEFAALLPHTTMEDARVVAERLREQIETRMKEKSVAVTCSIGLSGYPSDGAIPGELVTVADTALYYAKRTGGNRVYLSSRILSESSQNEGTNARQNGLSAIYALASTVEARDPCTYGHSRKVNTYAVALAEAIGLTPDQIFRVSTAALLHDVGKIGVPDKVLNKKGKLTAEDWEAIKMHPRLGATIIGNVPDLIPCVNTVLHHHERWDGNGYPEGLTGEQIPIEARILAVADAFEAMTSIRPYRPALWHDKATEQLRQGAGSQFDPGLVEVFIGIIEAGLPQKVSVAREITREETSLQHYSPLDTPHPGRTA